jgi:hypothetical protein
MKFLINGNEYDPVLGLQKVTLQTLFELKVKHGISVRDLQTAARKMDDIKDPMQLLEDVEAFQTFMVIIWLARRYAGEKLSLAEANSDFGLADLEIVHEETDEPEAAALPPKTKRASGPGGKRRKG